MKKLKSWRWKRIFQKETYQKEFDGGSFILIFTFVGLSLISLNQLAIVLGGLLIACVFSFLVYACTADDYLIVEKIDEDSIIRGKVHVIKLKSGYKLLFEWPQSLEKMVVDEYISSSFWPSDVHNLLYKKGESWYLVNKHNEHPVLMGKRIGKSIFAFTYLNSSEVLLKILNGSNFTEFLVDSYSYDEENLLVIEPKEAKYSTDENRVEFILIRKDDQYQLLACFSKYDSTPVLHIAEVKEAVAIVAKDGNKTVVFVQDNGTYKMVYSGQNFIRNIGLNVLELYSKGDLYGKMMRLNTKKLTLETIYDGRIYGVNFDDGEIICEGGRSYDPVRNKFFEA